MYSLSNAHNSLLVVPEFIPLAVSAIFWFIMLFPIDVVFSRCRYYLIFHAMSLLI